MRLRRVLNSDYFLLALLTLPAVLPLLLNPGLPNTADGVLHLYRTVELDRAWQDGVLYPRLAPDFAYGYGYPIFNYYAPLFYWLAQIFHVDGLSYEMAVKAAVILVFYLYPLGMYLLVRALMSRGAALVAATAYLYTSYRFYEAFIQGDYPQFLALAIVPFCLFALTPNPSPKLVLSEVEGLGEGRRGEGGIHFFTFIVAYAALILSHNITALIATPLIGAYILFVIATQYAIRTTHHARPHVHYALRVACSVSLAIALTAFFWLPALGEQRYVRIEKLTHGFFNFRKYFLTPGELLSPNIAPDLAGVNPYIPFNLEPVIVILALVGLVIGFANRKPVLPALRDVTHGSAAEGSQIANRIFFAAVALVLTALTLPISTPLWEQVPSLRLVEFPWRFVGLAAIPLAVLAGFAMRNLQFAIPSLFTVHGSLLTAFTIALITLDAFVYLFPRTPFLPYGNPSLRDIAQFELDSQALGTTSAGEYLPIWTQRRMYDSPLTSQLLRDVVPDHLRRESLPVTVRVEVLAQTVTREMYRFNSVGPLVVQLQRIYFPGWIATIDGQPAPLDLAAPNGTMRVAMPAGEHVVEFNFGETELRQIADWVSLMALLLMCGVWVYQRRKAGERGSKGAGGQTDAAAPLPLRSSAPLLLCALALIAFYFVAPRIGFVRQSPLPHVIGAQHERGDIFGDEMRLLGYDVSASAVTAGEPLALTLYWQPQRALQKDYGVFVHLDNPLTLETVAQTLNDRPGNISTIDLPLSLYVRDTHVLTTTASIEPGLYWLRVGLIDTRTGTALSVAQPDGLKRTRALLQTVRVRRAAPPDLSSVTRANVRFGQIELIGYALDAQHQLTLYWRATQTPQADATVFVHVLDSSKRVVSTFDGPPAGGLLPTSAWDTDEVVVDRRAITPADGTARIAVGLYDPQTQQRYAAQGADGQRLADDQFIIEVRK